ncbi:MAG: ligase-associated DNA damage response exonuclease [Flavobacteriaceae bacterium]
MRPKELLTVTESGLYCPHGGFHIDPHRPVDRALVTHGHADHARAGHGHVMATRQTLDIMAIRYGAGFAGATQAATYGREADIGGVRVRFMPAGHILGAAQIVLEHDGLRVVVSGDYKRAADPTCEPFEPVPCDVFITEATFGLPVFNHPPVTEEIGRLLTSMEDFPERTHVVGAYSLGKAQRLIALLRESGHHRPIHVHGALERLNAYYVSQGIDLGDLRLVADAKAEDMRGGIVIAPPSALGDRWMRRFDDPLTGFASGWMQIRARRRQRGIELPLILSDHIDWTDLTRTIREIAPGEVWVTHGREEATVRWCELNGMAAQPLSLIGFEDEAE